MQKWIKNLRAKLGGLSADSKQSAVFFFNLLRRID